MNTVNKGDQFELRSYHLISQAVINLKMGMIPDCCRVQQKPRYYSKDREKEIIFDLSLELWLPGASEYSMVWLFECKDLGKKVPVDDVEEFAAKVAQIAGAGKAVFISTSKLQKGALTYAKNKKMMVIEVDEDDKQSIILYNSRKHSNLLEDSDFLSIREEIRALREIQSFLFTNPEGNKQEWEQLMEIFFKHALAGNLNEISPDQTPIIGMERLSGKRIEQLTSIILNDFDPNILKHYFAPNIESLQSYLEKRYGLKVVTDVSLPTRKDRFDKGTIDLKNKIITIDKDVAASDRFAFVLAHEVGHFFLHSQIQIDQQIYDVMSDSEYNPSTKRYDLVHEKHWMEWQANYFAASLLMPRDVILIRLIAYQIQNDIRNKGRIYVDNSPHNIQLFKLTIDALSKYFAVSFTSMEYRMAELGIIRYAHGMRRPNTAFTWKLKSARTIKNIFNTMTFMREGDELEKDVPF